MKNLRYALAVAGLATGLSASAQDPRALLLGSSVPVAQAERSIVVGPDSPWVNVTQGETIKFTAGGTEFAWRFDGRSTRSFDLREIAPAGALSKPVTVYIKSPAGHRS